MAQAQVNEYEDASANNGSSNRDVSAAFTKVTPLFFIFQGASVSSNNGGSSNNRRRSTIRAAGPPVVVRKQ